MAEMDRRSGCVLFLAGKDIDEQVYQEEKRWSMYHDRMEKELRYAQDEYEKATTCFNDSKTLKDIRDKKKAACEAAGKGCKRAEKANMEYKASPSSLCFDFLRLDRGYWRRLGENPAEAFCLIPFHKQRPARRWGAVCEKFGKIYTRKFYNLKNERLLN